MGDDGDFQDVARRTDEALRGLSSLSRTCGVVPQELKVTLAALFRGLVDLHSGPTASSQIKARLHGLHCGKGISGGLDLTSLRNLDAGRILGVGTPPTADEISQLRRRFASAFHSDRANQLRDWVSQLFDQLLGIVNEACDRIRK